jgi:dynein heavy chain
MLGKWNDGICSDIIRRFTDDENFDQKWLIFDGNISSSWVERLETILEDSKTLFLTSNERILLSPEIQIFFETSDLQDVSPSIISRCGILHIDAQVINWRSLLLVKIANVDQFKGYENFIYKLFDWSIDPCLKFIHKCWAVALPLTDMQLVMSTLSLFQMYMTNGIEQNMNINEKNKDAKIHIETWSQAAIIMATNWVLTATLDYESKQKFEEFYLSLWNNVNNSYPCPSEIKQFEITLPSEGSLQDNLYIFQGIGSWKYCGEIIKTVKIKEDSFFSEPYIPTIDSVKLSVLFNLHIKYRKPLILCGERSNGKTSFIQECMSNLPESEYISNYFNYNFITKSDTAQQLFLSKLNKIKRYNYKPSKNRYCINFIDDLNATSNNEPNTNSTLELIRQYMDYSFLYDLKHPEKVNILNTIFIATLTTERRNLNNICPRFLRHFNIFTMYPQSKNNINQIFSKSLLIDLKKNSFTPDVLSNVSGIVNATVELYLSVIQNFRPTPSKILYNFSLHDVRRIMKGCSLIQKESVETKVIFIRLWAHEALRVLGDRIINDEDNEWLFSKIRESIKSSFKDPFESVFDYLPKYGNDELTKESFKNLIFGNFMDKETNKRKYEEINSIESSKQKLLQYFRYYNEMNKRKLDVVMTCYAVQHLVRICRILATPGGNLLIIGSSGSGRKSLTRLAAYIQQQCLFEPIIDIKYNECSWRKDIKSIMIESGTLKKDYTILVTDRQMSSEFIRYINSFLSFGEISQFFSNDEQRDIIKSVRLDAQKGNRNLELNTSIILKYFLNECKRKMHFILNISPIGKILQNYLCKYPKLIDQFTIDWLDCWPENAFEEVATHYMKDIDVQDVIKDQVIIANKRIYNSVKQISIQHCEKTEKTFYISPASFTRTMKIYTGILAKKQDEIKITKQRYITGLDKLQFAAREIIRMKNTLTKLKPQLEASARQTEVTMKEIETENICIEKATVLVKRDEEIANKKAEIASILKSECETELAVAIPILEDALEALNILKPTDITLVKSMKNPPDTVKLVMAAVCVMLNVPSERIVDPVTGKKSMDFWGPSKRVLGDMNFLQNLKDYDKDNIAPSIMATIKKTYMSDKNFMPHIVTKASSAAEGLCKWVRAMVSYDEVAKAVAPKKEKLAAAQRECDETDAFLNAKRKTLMDLNTKLATLKNTLETTLVKKLELESEVENCTKKLKKAEGLISSLGGEKTRWMDCANKLGRSFDNLAGDALLSSIMITYLSSLDLISRETNISEWKECLKTHEIPFSQEYDFINFLGSEIQINNWYLSGLPNHQFLLQNAIIMENSLLWCLFIDPQVQANEWIKSMENPNNLHVVKMTDDNFMDTIRKNIEIGNPVLLENLEEELDVTLEPLLSRNIYKISEAWYVNFGQDIVLFNPSFRFYLTTRYRKPRYSPDILNKITIINFCLPNDALQERLLNIVISREKPELQEKFEKVLFENVNNKQIIKQQEDKILHTLATCNSNILEDEDAIKILNSSKSLALDLLKRQEATKSIKDEIDAFRETYNQFTKYCTNLYNTLDVLPNLNYMYQFSLSWFIQLYIKSIETSNRSVIHKKRIDYLKMSSIQNLHQNVHTALFEKHRLIYSFILCIKTLLDPEQVTEQEFNIFININENKSTKYENEIIPNPASSWLSDKSWREILKISNSLQVFQNFANSFSINNTRWRKYWNSINCDDHLMPSPWDNKLTAFQKLILIKILCPDKIIFKITEFVEAVMGQSSNSFILCNISRPYAESNCLTPIIFILPSYSSSFSIVNKFAKVLGYSEKLHSLSMGPSQGQKAEILIEIARKNGEWVFLHNCHLDLPWMMKLEKICEDIDVSNTSLDFRLWMSTYSDKKFPLSILQNSIKIAFDSPYELKQTLTWAYKSELVKDKEFFEGCPGKDKTFSKLLYGFCLFHAIVRERKNFGCLSWNFEYDFDESDLQTSIIQLKNWINQYDKVPFKALIFLLECNYGGKIIDIQDKFYIDNLITDYCNHKVISDVNYDFDSIPAYRAPKRIEYKEHLKHIRNNIPNNASPEDFFFDKNVALIKNSNKVKVFVNSLSRLNETIVIHNVENKINQVQLIVFKILEMIPEDFNIEEVQEKYKVTESELLNYVLIEEITLYNKSLNIIRDSLRELNNAYNGYLTWTDKMEEISNDIFLDIVPNSWKTNIFLYTKKLLSNFITDLLERIKFINNWIDNGHPHYYWFGGMTSCKKLLSAIKTTFARNKQVPIDQVTFQFNVLEIKYPADDVIVPENCIYVYGLYLLGAKWNEQSKTLSDSKLKIFYNDMPVISFELTLKKTINSMNTYKCPLYISPNLHNSCCDSETLLNNYILSVNLKSNVNPKIWIKRGTALYCQAE